jgi:hypothetical protein
MSREDSDLRLAAAAAERARRLLLFPSATNLDRSRPFLEQACACLEGLRRSVGERPAARNQELLAGLRTLRSTVRRAAALLDGATRVGEPAPSPPPRSLSVEG